MKVRVVFEVSAVIKVPKKLYNEMIIEHQSLGSGLDLDINSVTYHPINNDFIEKEFGNDAIEYTQLTHFERIK